MPTGYTRQSAAEIATGQTVNASSFNNEFNAIQAAMDATTGHTHDGTVGGGAPITLTTSVTGILPIANGGTNASTAAGARTNLGLTIGTNVQAYDAGLQSISGLTTAADKMIYTTALDTYAVTDLTAAGRALLDDADATAQRTTLGLGTLSTQNANSVSVTGGTITGITDLAIADGGTGASDAATARTNLGLAIGTNVQAYDPALQSISGLTTAANQLIYTTALDTYAVTGLTAAGRAILDDADAAAQRATLGLGTIATQNASSVSVTNLTASGVAQVSSTTGNARLELFNNQIANVLVNSPFNGVDFLSTSDNTAYRSSVRGYVGGFSDQVGLDFVTYSVTSPFTRMRITPGGNVGIGTTNPSDILHVESSGTSRVRVKTTTASARTDLALVNSSNIVTAVYGHDGTNAEIDYRTGNLQFKYIGVTQATLSTSGQLGIGTTPSEQLHITGNFRIGDAVQATPSGSAPLFAARAWVNFNGTGTVAIRASGNITSITDNNTGDYTVNYTTAMPDANYAISGACRAVATGGSADTLMIKDGVAPLTTSVRIIVHRGMLGNIDSDYVTLAIFR